MLVPDDAFALFLPRLIFIISAPYGRVIFRMTAMICLKTLSRADGAAAFAITLLNIFTDADFENAINSCRHYLAYILS